MSAAERYHAPLLQNLANLKQREKFAKFGLWLKAQRRRDDPIGDLALDVQDDGRLLAARGESPPCTFAEFRHHIQRIGCDEAVTAATEAWREYRAHAGLAG